MSTSSKESSNGASTDDDHISYHNEDSHEIDLEKDDEKDFERHDPEKHSTDINVDSIQPTPLARIASHASHALQKVISRSHTNDQSPPPDGGFRAWSCVVMTHMVNFNTWGLTSAFGILQTYYVENLGHPPSDVSWIGSLQAFLLFFLGVAAGRLTDAGYFRQVFATGSCLVVLGIFSTSVSTQYWQVLLAQGLCMGIGGGLVFTSALSVTGTYFERKRPLALGIVAMANSDGALVHAAILQQLLPKIGFAWTMRVVGLLLVIVLVVANIVIKPRQLKRSQGPIIEWAAFKERPYRYFTLGMFVVFLGTFFPVYYIGSFGRDIIHISTHDSSSLILIINGIGLASRVPAIYTANRFTGPLNLMIPFIFSTTIILWCWIAVTNREGLFAWDCVYGIFMAGFQTLFPATIGSLIEDVTKMGIRNGMVLTIVSFAFLTGPPLCGGLIQAGGGSYLYAQIFTGICFVLGVVLLLVTRTCKVGFKLMVRA